MKVEIYEDNSGEIRYRHNGKIYSLGSYPRPGQLLKDLVSVDDWIGDFNNEEASENDLLIAEFDGQKITIHFDALGNSGKQYAGIED